MGRLWLGIGLMAALLLGTAGIALGMDAIHQPVAAQLEQAGTAALEGDWAQADAQWQAAQRSWERHWALSASVADHSPMDDIDRLYAQLAVFAQERETVHFAATCMELSELTQAMSDAHSPDWWNLL
ncbi:MAG TPA: DUF4363 family protein [Candidatus Faecousia intestinigallinarum]|nr:DUF4363 family protein [Candidatus Faecousia intestinigallinarum]